MGNRVCGKLLFEMDVSYPQACRLKSKAGGIPSLAQGNRGSSQSNKLSEDVRQRIVGLSVVGEEYFRRVCRKSAHLSQAESRK